jgi:hypothetical protein
MIGSISSDGSGGRVSSSPAQSLSCQWAAVMRAASFAEVTTADTGGPPAAL